MEMQAQIMRIDEREGDMTGPAHSSREAGDGGRP